MNVSLLTHTPGSCLTMTRFWVIYDWISRRQRGGQSVLQAAKFNKPDLITRGDDVPCTKVCILQQNVYVSNHLSSRYKAASEIFKETYNLFYDALSATEKENLKVYEDVGDFVNAIRRDFEQICNPDRQNRLEKCVRHFRNFGRRIEPYFDVVNIFVQTHPEYLGLVWGTLTLLFKVRP